VYYRKGKHEKTEGKEMNERMNGFFGEMETAARKFETARAARNAEKEELCRAGDWDGVEAWGEREKQFAFPYTDGQIRAYRTWKRSMDRNSSMLEAEDLPWEKDIPDFVRTLREAGAETFAVTDQSTALMRSLHALAAEGCTVEGLCTITRREDRYGSVEEREMQGISIRL